MPTQIAARISSGSRRRATSDAPMSRGSSARSHEGPAIGLPTRPGGPHTATAVSPAATIPIPASTIMPGSSFAQRRTACTHRT